MPELPEVESVRRSLMGAWVGRTIGSVEVHRAEVICGEAQAQALLCHRRIADIRRLGKHLLIVGESVKGDQDGAPCIAVHLGMTGSLTWFAPLPSPSGRGWTGTPGRVRGPANNPLLASSNHAVSEGPPTPTLSQRERGPETDSHAHVIWHTTDGGCVVFRDPRRFGGLWTYPSVQAAQAARWSKLGPDALVIQPADLHRRLQRTRRAIKAALLDQHVLAGLGNIYVDELLFACRIHPATPAHRLDPAQLRDLVAKMRRLLARAIAAKGSTVRDYSDGRGQAGRFQFQHRVYGRSGQRCRCCDRLLSSAQIGGRTTVFCRHCQPASSVCSSTKNNVLNKPSS